MSSHGLPEGRCVLRGSESHCPLTSSTLHSFPYHHAMTVPSGEIKVVLSEWVMMPCSGIAVIPKNRSTESNPCLSGTENVHCRFASTELAHRSRYALSSAGVSCSTSKLT